MPPSGRRNNNLSPELKLSKNSVFSEVIEQPSEIQLLRESINILASKINANDKFEEIKTTFENQIKVIQA
jgi:ABC-type hemin transport system substrate-binding protein